MNNWSIVTGHPLMPGAQFYSDSPELYFAPPVLGCIMSDPGHHMGSASYSGLYMEPHMMDMRTCAAQSPYIRPTMSGAQFASASPELYMEPHMWDMRACAAQPFCIPCCSAAHQQNLLNLPDLDLKQEKGSGAKRQKRGKRKRKDKSDYDQTAEPPHTKHCADFTAQPVKYDAITTSEGDIIFSEEILDMLCAIPGIWHLAEEMGSY
ncbi:hypothetical protein AMEX_G14287 [Astyanax mexicanus]|uniref:Uncharacterized protein n=1 Tax=Astyanax mexicanus TaxID=7994 RepID=A0A8T2LN88_ASTMX|nr:hypothetical protein AMEX_G14287 [Astyanax mexicanus]